MKNDSKTGQLLIRVFSDEHCFELIWDGLSRLEAQLPPELSGAVRGLDLYTDGGQIYLELRSENNSKYIVKDGSYVQPDEQPELRIELSALPELRVESWELPGGRELLLGRGAQADITVPDADASRSHAMLSFKSGSCVLTDLDSTHGTFVNGARIEKACLHDGDVFRIADSYFQLDRGQLRRSTRPIRRQSPDKVFKPAPQMRTAIQPNEMTIQKPPQKINKPEINWLSVCLPVIIAVLLAVILSMFFGGNTIMMAALSVATFVTTVINYRSQTKKAVSSEDERQKKYEAYLDKVEAALSRAHERELSALERENPSAEACMDIARRRALELWSRKPENGGFTSVRLGTGDASAAVCAQFTEELFSAVEDPLQTRAAEIARGSRTLPGAPIVLPEEGNRVVGIVAECELTDLMQRQLIIQLSTLCPSTVLRIAAFAPGRSWSWLRWLPHTHTAERAGCLLSLSSSDAGELSQLLREGSAGDAAAGRAAEYCVFIPDGGCFDGSLLSLAADSKERVPVRFFVSCRSIAQLPKECTTIIELRGDECTLYGSGSTQSRQRFAMEPGPSPDCDLFSRTLAGIRREAELGSGKLPDSVTFMEGYGLRRAEDWDLGKAWSSARPEKSLAVPIGVDEYGKTFYFDISDKVGRDGVHGVVGGMAGSGKTEMLQAYLLSLAMNFSPRDVSFVIVDFKGSGLLSPFEGLPHLAGAISNLDTDIKRNADSLQHEIERREALFKEHGAQNIAGYWEREKQAPGMEHLPLLIVAIDEFAMLQKSFPYFTGIVEKNYTLSRSLGIWFVLATQQPANITSAAIKDNTHYKWLLKVPDPGVSRSLIGIPDAAQITLPGRAYVRVDSSNKKSLTLVQSFYSGAKYRPGGAPAAAAPKIALVDPLGKRTYIKSGEPEAAEDTTTQIEMLVSHIRSFARKSLIPDAQKVWKDKLAGRFPLERLAPPRGPGLCPVIGEVDDPKHQEKHPLTVDLTGSGHMAVYGAPVTGKTTFLRTLMMALATQYTPDDVHIYAMDFGSYGLRAFDGFPHVGGVADAEDEEKLRRLAQLLTQEQARRKRLLASLGVGSISAYRQMERLQSLDPLPEIVLVVDNFRAALEQEPWLEEFFLSLVQKGAGFGMYLAASVAGSSCLPTKFNDSIKTVFSLRQSDRMKYSDLVGKTDGLYPEEHVGRGLVKSIPPLEFQLALPADGTNDAEITVAIKRCAEEKRAQWKGPRAPRIPVMPERIRPGDIDSPHPALGLFTETIEPAVFDETRQFYLLVSAVESERGHALLMLLSRQMAEKQGCELWFFDAAHTCAPMRPLAGRYLAEASEIDAAVESLMPVMEQRRKEKQQTPEAEFPPLLLAVTDYDVFHQQISEKTAQRMELLIRLGKGLGVYVLAECSADRLVQLGGLGIIKAMQGAGQAVMFGGCIEKHYGFNIEGLTFSQRSAAIKKDEGFLVEDGKPRRFKVISEQKEM